MISITINYYLYLLKKGYLTLVIRFNSQLIDKFLNITNMLVNTFNCYFYVKLINSLEKGMSSTFIETMFYVFQRLTYTKNYQLFCIENSNIDHQPLNDRTDATQCAFISTQDYISAIHIPAPP